MLMTVELLKDSTCVPTHMIPGLEYLSACMG